MYKARFIKPVRKMAVSDLERIADYITLIDHGRIFYTGTKDNLLEHFYIVKGNITDLTDLLKRNLRKIVLYSFALSLMQMHFPSINGICII